jgi:thiol-disulfide isomerase/thioredoxin
MKKNLILLFVTVLFIAGCSTDYEILKSYDSISLTADSSVKLVGETITFTVKDNQGTDLTQDATFYVDNVKIEGNTYSSSVIGSHTVTAEYYTVASTPLVINFHDGTEINFRKRMLIEDYTGTWCGYCPRVAWAIELVHQQTDDAVAVAIHGPSSDPSNAGYDPYYFDATELTTLLNFSGYPQGYLNRMTRWKALQPNNVDQAIAFTQGENPKMGVAITSDVTDGNITMDVNVRFGKDFGNNLRLVVYVVENGLIYEQHNYTSYYGGEDILHDFEHNHVLRSSLTPLLGEAIDANQTKTAQTYTRTFEVPVPANVANAANIEFIAFVVDENNNVVNVRKAHPGEAQTFEQL